MFYEYEFSPAVSHTGTFKINTPGEFPTDIRLKNEFEVIIKMQAIITGSVCTIFSFLLDR